MNVVMNSNDDFIEIQGTAEGHPFNAEELNNMLALAKTGIQELTKFQEKALAE
jgi:ribonuclease PH